ncbi:hypothetical protein SEA_PUPPER_65 [Gordonia phage Pupper]|uniref:Uncharacterized protein n=1 Tax=Gordonia phage Pupper TaxID=2571249 RepID=A0A4Y6EMB3_9CAUD|nr:hypothetical protein KHQ83_gp212 [Gordonia phage Pupper]QDF18551.1 hypothetical protein SEA_PUPPER_65 [Gordonia phage Pupper]
MSKHRRRQCPDDGTCHHFCQEMQTGCWRVGTCGPLSGVFPNNQWPDEVVEAESRAG